MTQPTWERLPRVRQVTPTSNYDPAVHAMMAAEIVALAGDAFRANEKGAHALCKMAQTHATIALAFCASSNYDV